MFCRNCGKELIGTPEICPSCGAKPLIGSSFCQACGAATNPLAEICTKCGARLGKTETADVSPKSRLITTSLCILPMTVGIAGLHRLYLGKVTTGIMMLLIGILGYAGIVGGFLILFVGLYRWESSLVILWPLWFIFGGIFLAVVGIWAFIDFIFAVSGNMKDKEGRPIKNW